MPAGSNRGGSSLRILWIPGKKRNNKGVYQPTNKSIEHKHTQKKLEPWSLGHKGGHLDDDFVTKTPEIVGEASTSAFTTTSILPTAAGVAAINDESSDKPISDKASIKDIDDDDCGRSKDDAGSSSSSPRSTGYDTATLVIGEKKNGLRVNKRDYDSIERLDDIDAAIVDNNNVKNRRPVHRQKYPIEPEDGDKKDDKTVKCLYYTLMCCECTIS